MGPSNGEGKSAVVIGGGLVGCMSGLLLARKGYQVNIFEMREGKHFSFLRPPCHACFPRLYPFNKGCGDGEHTSTSTSKHFQQAKT